MTRSGSRSTTSSHSLIANLSGLFAVVIFLQEMWGQSRIEHTILTAASAGLAAYLILAVAFAAARAVVTYEESAPREEVQNSEDDSSSQGETDNSQSVPETQAA